MSNQRFRLLPSPLATAKRPLARAAAAGLLGVALLAAGGCTSGFSFPGFGSQPENPRPADPARPQTSQATQAPGPTQLAAPPSLAGGQPSGTPQPAAPAAPPPPPILSFDRAVERAADVTFNTAESTLGMPASGVRELVIDPLVDASTGQQTVSSDQMGKMLTEYIARRRPGFKVVPFTRDTLARQPVLMIGTLTAVNAKNEPNARNDAYRIWLTLVDLRTGRVIGKSIQRASEDTVDARPTEYFRDSPTWVRDRTVAGYINSCQINTKIGDPIDTVYLMRLPAAAVTNEAITAYNERRYADAYRLYSEASAAADPHDLRVLNGLYLSATKLRRQQEAQQAFGKIVAAGFESKRLPLKILFTPGSTQFVSDAQLQQQYPMWIRQVAQQASATNTCLRVVGHTSRTGAPDVNDTLSARRADVIRTRVERDAQRLGGRIAADGVGFRENLVGIGTDDLRDALDRRVEFRVVDCPRT